MASVQFYGLEKVMWAAENLNCPAWGIFIGTSLFTKYEGSNMEESMSMLEKNLEALQEGGTTAVYKLKFFEGEKGKPIKINERSVCDGGSFLFKLQDNEERQMRMLGSTNYGELASLRKEIADMKQTLLERQTEPDDEPEEDESIGSIVMGLLKNPDQLGQLVNIGRAALGLPVQQLPQQVASIGAIPDFGSKEHDLDRLTAAIDTLEKHDPRLVDHLEKLARMATETPDQFKAMLSMLDLKM